MKAIFVPVLALLQFLQCVQSAKILGIFPLPSRSHYILGSSLMKGLAEGGHDVTVISPFGEKKPPGIYRDIVLKDMMTELFARRSNLNMFEIGDLGPFINIPFIASFMSAIGELALKEKGVQDLIHSEEKFDAVIIEQFYDDSLKTLAYHFDAVQIIFSTIGANFWFNPLVGNPSPLAYIPDTFLSYPPHMTFCQRLENTLVYIFNLAVHHLYLYPKHDKFSQLYIPKAPSLDQVLYNVSLVLSNSHPSLNQAVPYVPNMIEIGGFHIKPPKQLPEDLKKFLDEAKDGVVYLSFGSNLNSTDLPKAKREAILNVFSKLKERVLWKWEDETLPGKPDNVKVSKWLPQQALLAHPKVKLFITHGGLLSTTETIYFGKPVLAIPIFGDQKLNAQNAVDSGFGLKLNYNDLTEENLREKVNELLTNPQYSEKAKTKSKVFHDRLVKPMDTALYWVDYVVRHKGAPHLRVAAVDLPWYQYFLIDVMAFIAAVVLVGVFISYVVLKKICKRLCGQKKKVKKN